MRKLERILAVLVLCMMTTIGALMGTKLESQQIEKQKEYTDGISTTVAIVNQDTGVIIDGETTNYADAIVETLGSGYSIASAAVAENGLKEGTYGAIVMFPSDFSKNIVSINEKNPKQAIIEMTIHPGLPEDKYVALHDQLISLQQEINNNIASTYVETVFMELHAAQDEIDTLLANDEKDMSAVEQMQLAKYTEYLNLEQLPLMQYTTAQANYAELYEEAHGVARDMNETYVESYHKAQEDFEKVQMTVIEQEQNVMTRNGEWVAEAEQWAADITGYAAEVESYRQELDDWRKDSITFQEEADVFFNDAYMLDQNLQIMINDLNANQQKLLDWQISTEVAIDAAKVNGESLSLQTQNLRLKIDEISASIQPETYAELCAILGGMDAEISALQSEIGIAGTGVPEKMTAIDNTALFNAVLPSALADVPEFDTGLPNLNFPGQPAELTEALHDLVDIYTGFNPDEYMNAETTEKAMENMTRYDKHLTGVETMIADVNSDNREQMHTIYEGYNDYVSELRTEIIDVHEREQQNLSENIGKLASVLTETSADNHQIMDSFVSRMPNSRQRTSVNQKVVSNTVQPITYSYEYARTQNQPQIPDFEKYLGITMIILLAIAGAIVLFAWWRDKMSGAKMQSKADRIDMEKAI